MTLPDLYPELTRAEVEEVIDPVTVSRASEDPLVVSPAAHGLTSFGREAEEWSFARVCRSVAGAVLDEHWPALDLTLVRDEGDFRARVHSVLATDVSELLVRPLAAALAPVDGRDDGLVYAEFCRDLLADGLDRFAAAHPVAWDRLGLRLNQRLRALAETLRRVRADHADLVVAMDLAPEARITGIGLAGDTHAGGRTVSVIELDDGSSLVYKPRTVDCEAGWAELVDVLNHRHGFGLRAARVVPRRGYGYVEFVEVDPAATIDLRSVGRLAAVLYALNARDMHFTNILSTADGPVPVDLETLLHPLRQKSHGTPETEDSGYTRLAVSVFGTGILPMVMAREGRDGYADVGYLGGGEVHGSGPFRQFRIEHPFSARIRVGWAPEVPPSVEPSRVIDTSAAIVRDSCAAMVEGFSEVYATIVQERTSFIAAVRQAFAGAEVRYVHNATVQYAQCLRVLTAPSPSRDADLAQGLVKRIGIASRGADPRLVDAECAQLWATDVPYFVLRSDSTTVTDGSPERRPVAELPSSPLAQCVAKIEALSPHDLVTQVRLIRVAFNAKLPDPHTMAPTAEVLAPFTAVERDGGQDGERDADSDTDADRRALAAEVAQDLVDDMVQDRYAHLPATWIGPVATAVANRPWPPGVLGYDLYTGRVGPALTLAVLSALLDDPGLAQASSRVFEPSAQILDAGSFEARSISRSGNGAYSGFPGALWAMAHAGRALGKPALTRSARRGLDLLESTPAQSSFSGDGWYDLISGDVGAVLVRLALGQPGAERDAVAACDHALAGGVVHRMEQSGFAHGLAGLLHLAGRTHEAARDDASARLADAVVHELDTVFGGAHGTPRTNRTGPLNESDSWCNGSAGLIVGMTTAARAGLVDPARVNALVTGVEAASIATSTTLCHGALGMYDVLALAEPFAPETAGGLRRRLARYLDVARLREFLASPDSRYNQGPCLMVGRAGVAWHLATRCAGGLPSPLELSAVTDG
ncbi:type 2 lanthipeptide synthetase LanM [Knoellia sp. CPCC 206450]|uniref:type 2 lanthipeptide synthetase LanM n=1 Tax=Knoellia tibetensis TaxID=3404798 RepID=UPI003B4393EA